MIGGRPGNIGISPAKFPSMIKSTQKCDVSSAALGDASVLTTLSPGKFTPFAFELIKAIYSNLDFFNERYMPMKVLPELKLGGMPIGLNNNNGKSVTTSIRTPAKRELNPYVAKRHAVPPLIGICGIPGAGKSTTAEMLGKLWGSPVLSMDGFHLPLERLKEEQGDTGVYWRGAPQTFDEQGFYEKLLEVKEVLQQNSSAKDHAKTEGEKQIRVSWPSFDHAIGDPDFSNEEEISTCRPIIVEGLYLLHWERCRDLFDFVVFMEFDVEKGISRLKVRNKCLPGYTPAEIDIRCDTVDRANAMLVIESYERTKEKEKFEYEGTNWKKRIIKVKCL